MTDARTKEQLLGMVKVFLPDKDPCYSLVERLQDFVEEIAEQERERGYDEGFCEGQGDSYDEGYMDGLDAGREENDDFLPGRN